MQNGRSTHPHLHRQRGNVMVGVIIAILVVALLSIWYSRVAVERSKTQAGETYGQAWRDINDALGSYITDSARAQSIRSSSTIVGVANILSPTIAELQTLGLFSGSTVRTTPFNGGSYQTQIVLTPSGCSGAACLIGTRLWASNPILDSSTGRPDIVTLGAMLSRLQGKAGFSASSGVSINAGSLTLANPDTSTPTRAGILLAVNGEGSLVDANYLRINDTRDPNLQGNLTTAGYLGLGGTATQGAACTTANQVARSSTGVLLLCTGGTWQSASGIDQLVVADGACTAPAIGHDANGVLMTCQGGVWKAASGTPNNVAQGQACASSGLVGTNATGTGFVCRGGVYQPLSSLLASSVNMSRTLVADASLSVAKPICQSGGTQQWEMIPISLSMDLSVAPPYATVSYTAVDQGTTWLPRITLIASDGSTESGNVLSLSAWFKTACYYPS